MNTSPIDHVHKQTRQRCGWAMCTITALLVAASSWPAITQPTSDSKVVELRQYTLRPGQRDVLIALFEAEFVESQEAVGMTIIGTFRDLDNPDRFVWIRAFKDMSSRAEGLDNFYTGPIWKAHGKAAAATMVDSSNVLLLRDASPGSGFKGDTPRPPKGATDAPSAVIVATIYYFAAAVEPSFVEFFERAVQPQLREARIPVLASFVTETAANNYPPLPVREHDRVFVWFSRFADQTEYDERVAALARSAAWTQLAGNLAAKLKSAPETLRLQPTPRSQLR